MIFVIKSLKHKKFRIRIKNIFKRKLLTTQDNPWRLGVGWLNLKQEYYKTCVNLHTSFAFTLNGIGSENFIQKSHFCLNH